MIIVLFLVAYIVIGSALLFVFTVAEDKMNSFYCWCTCHDRAVACAIFWPVSALPYVAYVAAVYYTRPRRRE